MDQAKRAALEAAGFRIGDAADFLGLTEEESRLVDLRLAVARAIRALRTRLAVSQGVIARRIGSSQPRVAKIEAASPDVSLDVMFRCLFAVGGSLADLSALPAPSSPPPPIRSRPAAKRVARADSSGTASGPNPEVSPSRRPPRKAKRPLPV